MSHEIEDSMSLKIALIQHLSKEIETHTNGLTDFRAKTSFTLLVGPFILLGSFLVLAKTINVRLPVLGNWINIGLLVSLGLCFMAIGVACSRIEKHIFTQNNVWRGEIKRLTGGLLADHISSQPSPSAVDISRLPTPSAVDTSSLPAPTDQTSDPHPKTKAPKKDPYAYNAKLIYAYLWFYFLVLLTFACGGFLFSRLDIIQPPSASAPPPVSGSTPQEQPPPADPRKP